MFRLNSVVVIILFGILSFSVLAVFNLDGAQLEVSAASANSSATELWSFTATNHTSYNATPYWYVTTIQDRIYAVESEHYNIPGENNPLIPYYRTIDTLYAFANDGKKLWSFTETAFSLPTAIDKTVYISGRSIPWGGLNNIYALDADSGAQKWMLSFQGDIHWRTFADNVMYVGVAHIWTGEGYFIYAVNVTTGQQIWRQTFHWGDDYPEDVIVDNGVIYFAHSRIPTPEGYEGENEYFAINATDGSTVWKVLLNGSVYGPSALISGLICFSSEGEVYALNATNGAIVWSTMPETDYHFSSTFGSNNDIIYTVGYPESAGQTNGALNVVALNALDGSKLWNYAVSGSQIRGFNGGFYAIDPIGNNLYFHVDARSTYVLNAITGQQLWSHSDRPSTINNDVAYWYSGNNLEALDASNGKSIWNCTTTATFVSAQNYVEYFSVGSTIYALHINANSSFEPTYVVSPSPSSNPATPNPTAINPTSTTHSTDSPAQTPNSSPTPITPELPAWVTLPIVTMTVVIAVALLKRKTRMINR